MSCGIGIWLDESCVRHPRIWGGALVLLRYFNKWLRAHKQDACDLDGFKELLGDERLQVIDVAGTLLVPGLCLKYDGKTYFGR